MNLLGSFLVIILSSLMILGRAYGQVNIIGVPRSEQSVDLVLRDGAGKEIAPGKRPVGPVTVGTTLVLYCETKHPAISHLAWSRDGTEVYGPVSRFSDGLLQNELRVTVAPADRAAEYKCRGLNLRLDAVVERSLRLDITDPVTQVPSFSAIPVQIQASILPANGTFKANETVTLRCLAQGSRGPAIITWWRDERLLNDSTVSAAPGITVRNGLTTTESSFTFKVTSADHGGTIYCRAVSALSQLHENNTAEAVLKLDVYYLPITNIAKNETIFSKENGPISISCTVRAFPPADKVRWYRNEKMIFEDRMKMASPGANETKNGESLATKNEVQTNALRILQMSRGDVGSYSCEAHNSAGWSTRSNSVDVKIPYKPGTARSAKQQATTEIHAAEGEKLTLTCTLADASASPMSTFVWRKEGTVLARGQTYTINPVQEKHFGSYTCAPFNGATEGDAAAINLTKKEEAVLQSAETTVLMIASVLGVVGGTILLAIVVWCLCLSKSCRKRSKNKHLTSTFMTGTYPSSSASHMLAAPPPLLPRPHLITNHNPQYHQHSSCTLSRESHPPPRPGSQMQKQLTPAAGGGFMFGNSNTNTANNNNSHGTTARPNYYPSWYSSSQRTERTNSYLGRNYKY